MRDDQYNLTMRQPSDIELACSVEHLPCCLRLGEEKSVYSFKGV